MAGHVGGGLLRPGRERDDFAKPGESASRRRRSTWPSSRPLAGGPSSSAPGRDQGEAWPSASHTRTFQKHSWPDAQRPAGVRDVGRLVGRDPAAVPKVAAIALQRFRRWMPRAPDRPTGAGPRAAGSIDSRTQLSRGRSTSIPIGSARYSQRSPPGRSTLSAARAGPLASPAKRIPITQHTPLRIGNAIGRPRLLGPRG